MSQPAEKPTISNAQARWELENDVQTASASDLDALYRFDAEEQKEYAEAYSETEKKVRGAMPVF